MDLKGEEVLITLTPLGAPEEFTRRLTVNETIRYVEVGRASKNAEKGLVAGRENAWFDSPIMSRQHAKFSIKPSKTTYLQDQDSTHGTYIGNLRLEAYKNYSINNNDVVTFGVRVTSGARTYMAKEFRVSLEWRPFRPMRKQIASTIVGSQSIGFHVPVDDEIDSSSESSRGGSVQIPDSHARSFSVPSSEESLSSDDDDDDDDNDDNDDEGQVSAPKEVQHHEPMVESKLVLVESSQSNKAAPHPAIEIRTEAPPCKEADLTSPNETRQPTSTPMQLNDSGPSPSYPIGLGDGAAHHKIVPSSDSEDEPPEVLSSKENHIFSSKCLPASFGTQTAHSPCLPAASPYASRQAEHGVLDRGRVNEPEYNTKSRTEIEDTFLEKLIGQSTDGLESFDGEDYGPPPCSPCYYVDNRSAEVSYPSPPVWASAGERLGLKFYSRERKMKEDFEDNIRKIVRQVECCEAAAGIKGQDCADRSSVTGRPPSPSDAALAKKAAFVDQRSFWPVMKDSQSHAPVDSFSEHQTQSSKPPGLGYEDCTDFNLSGTNLDERMDSIDYLSSDLGRGRPTEPPQIRDPITKPPTSRLLNVYETMSTGQDRPAGSARCCSVDSCTGYCDSSATSRDPSTSIAQVIHQRKEIGSQSSRLNISDIVHPQGVFRCNLKRKADEMSVDEAEPMIDEEFHVSLSESSQDVLPDAQPREITALDETGLMEESSKASPKVAITVQRSSPSGPSERPRKRFKTSVSTAVGIGKFVSGVCFGVVGVFAAFIATIPLSVQEEALQELVESA
jgi:hypothetical protein